MIKTRKIVEEVVSEEVIEVSCDICDVKINRDEFVEIGTVMMFRGSSDIIDDKFSNFTECETTDLCKKCYTKTIDFLKSLAPEKTLPSFIASSEEEEFDEMLDGVTLFGDDEDDDEKHNIH